MFGKKKKRKAMVDENEFDDYDSFDDSENEFDSGDADTYDDPIDEYDEEEPAAKSKKRSGRKPGKGKGGKRTGGSGIAEILPVVLGILIAGFVLYLGVMAIFGPRRGECKKVISQFEEGCQTLNVDEIAYCFKPSTRNAILAVTAIGGAVTDSSSEEVLVNLLDVIGGGLGQITQGSDMKLSELFKIIDIEPKRYGLPGLKRDVRCKATYGVFTAYIKFTFEKKDGEVYITNLEFEKE